MHMVDIERVKAKVFVTLEGSACANTFEVVQMNENFLKIKGRIPVEDVERIRSMEIALYWGRKWRRYKVLGLEPITRFHEEVHTDCFKIVVNSLDKFSFDRDFHLARC
ncbi:MAG: hypothetical protein KC493_15805 [Bacteriovoracaceae bacterium]|nr:hypothetical protein [Bacteriovoracaceae bacterium]